MASTSLADKSAFFVLETRLLLDEIAQHLFDVLVKHILEGVALSRFLCDVLPQRPLARSLVDPAVAAEKEKMLSRSCISHA